MIFYITSIEITYIFANTYLTKNGLKKTNKNLILIITSYKSRLEDVEYSRAT